MLARLYFPAGIFASTFPADVITRNPIPRAICPLQILATADGNGLSTVGDTDKLQAASFFVRGLAAVHAADVDVIKVNNLALVAKKVVLFFVIGPLAMGHVQSQGEMTLKLLLISVACIQAPQIRPMKGRCSTEVSHGGQCPKSSEFSFKL